MKLELTLTNIRIPVGDAVNSVRGVASYQMAVRLVNRGYHPHLKRAAWLPMKELISKQHFKQWIEHSLDTRENVLAVSNQGTILLYQEGDQSLIVKTAMGSGVVLKARQKTLRREFAAYQRMNGLNGIPECYGLLEGRYLVIEHIEGTPYRTSTWADREAWFVSFLEVLRGIHARGVSHGDLKSKGNILVTKDQKPCVIDFGTAFMLKKGFHPINNWFFNYGARLDINAWVKHKYHGRYVDASEEDRALLDYGRIELVARKISGRPMDAVPGKRRD
jgi:predicted Ser/Thr protein kinase